MKYAYFFLAMAFAVASCTQPQEKNETNDNGMIKFMTLDPGHFHAALVQKSMYEGVDSVVHVYAPEGPELEDFLSKIESYNTREDNPTHWDMTVYRGNDFLDKMIAEKPGNVMIVAGKNAKKIDYILAAVEAGLNVYADKPLVINPEGFAKLEKAFETAKQKGVMIYDIMTERFETTTILQKMLSQNAQVFGELTDGTPEAPAISKESVHHFYKNVSGKPLVRPAWFFDVNEEGEGIVDVTTHLVDLVQWEAFPEQVIDRNDIELLQAKHWATTLSLPQFQQVTKLETYPDYLKKDLNGDKLNVLSNGEMLYKIKGKYAKVSVIWNFEAPAGAGDTHYSTMRGTKADLAIKQGPEQNYKPTLYVTFKNPKDSETALISALTSGSIGDKYMGLSAKKISNDTWEIIVPEEYKIGHEAHFGQVTENFLNYLKANKLPDWEVPNMLTKYYTTTSAYTMANR